MLVSHGETCHCEVLHQRADDRLQPVIRPDPQLRQHWQCRHNRHQCHSWRRHACVLARQSNSTEDEVNSLRSHQSLSVSVLVMYWSGCRTRDTAWHLWILSARISSWHRRMLADAANCVVAQACMRRCQMLTQDWPKPRIPGYFWERWPSLVSKLSQDVTTTSAPRSTQPCIHLGSLSKYVIK